MTANLIYGLQHRQCASSGQWRRCQFSTGTMVTKGWPVCKMPTYCRTPLFGGYSLGSGASPEHTPLIVSSLEGSPSFISPTLCLLFCSSQLFCLCPELISCSLFTKRQPLPSFFKMLSFRNRKTRWPSEDLPQGACLTRIISEGLSVPMMLNEFLALLHTEWLPLRNQGNI